MSKTYHKNIRIGVCSGSNTMYYRNRNRKVRRTNKSLLKSAVSQYEDDEIQENLNFIKLPKNTWDEPTDGTHTYNKKQLNLLLEIENDKDFMKWWKKLLRNFK